MDKPNILYLHSHDTGRCIEPYGYPVSTPALAQFARESVVFRAAFSAAPTCSPSRSALLTGMCPHSNGMLGLAHRGFRLHDYTHHIVHTLASEGYHCALAGIQHVAEEPGGHATIGYDEYLGDRRTAEESAVRFLKTFDGSRFFLSVGFFETHREFPTLDSERDADFVAPPAGLPDSRETRIDAARYAASASLLDSKMGAILRALDDAGQRENTLVIITTDHGIAFPGMKCNLTDAGTGVMLMIRGPAPFDKPAVVDAMVSHLDVFPTICDLADIEKPARLQGVSMVPLLSGEVGSLHDALFSEVSYHAAYEPTRAVRTRRYKYIRRYDGRTRPVLANCDDGESKTYLLSGGWASRPPQTEALYDLLLDPLECHNIVDEPRRQDIVEDLRNRLQLWMEETGDPLLAGWVPAPKGAKINDPDSDSPKAKPFIV